MKFTKLTDLYKLLMERIRKHDQRKSYIKHINDKMEGMNDQELSIMFHAALRIEDHRELFLADPVVDA